MFRHRDGDARHEAAVIPSDLVQLGRMLRRARLSRGLTVPDAARQASISIGDVESLEDGEPRRLPDAVRTVNLLRHYAEALGLPADRYALALLDAWPTTAGAPGPAGAPDGAVPSTPPPAPHDPTQTWVPAPGTARGWPPPTTGPITGRLSPDPPNGDPAVSGAGYHADVDGRAPLPAPPGAPLPAPPGAPLPAPPGAPLPAPPGAQAHPVTALLPLLNADTGPTDAVAVPGYGGAAQGPLPASPGAPRTGGLRALRLAVAVLIILIVAGIGALAVHHWRPQWLRSIEHSSTTASPHLPAMSHGGPSNPAQAEVSAAVPSSSTSATVTVNATDASIRISTTIGTSWMLVSQENSSTPLFAQDIQSGEVRTFPLQSPLTVQMGAGAARVAVTVRGSVLRSFAPPSAPYTFTFRRA